MTISLIAFILSGIGILMFLGLKMLQERSGFLLFWPDTRSKCDVVVGRHVKKLKRVAGGFNKRNTYIVLHYFLVKIRGFFVYLQEVIDKKLVHLMNLIKGRRILDSRGKTSHFLKDINHFKDSFRRP